MFTNYRYAEINEAFDRFFSQPLSKYLNVHLTLKYGNLILSIIKFKMFFYKKYFETLSEEEIRKITIETMLEDVKDACGERPQKLIANLILSKK